MVIPFYPLRGKKKNEGEYYVIFAAVCCFFFNGGFGKLGHGKSQRPPLLSSERKRREMEGRVIFIIEL